MKINTNCIYQVDHQIDLLFASYFQSQILQLTKTVILFTQFFQVILLELLSLLFLNELFPKQFAWQLILQYPFYLKLQKMQSNHEFILQSEMESARQRVGLQPLHFIPKISADQIFVTDNIDFGQNISSVQDLPKFASSKIPSQTNANRNYYQASRQIFQNLFENLNKSIAIYPLRPQNGRLTSLLLLIIWIAYAVGTSQITQQINFFNVIDFCGMGIALIYSLYSIIFNKSQIQFDHFLHFMGITITIVLFTYSSSSGDPFISVLIVIRSLRLFFIMNSNFSFQNLALIYCHKMLRVIKVLLPWVFLTILFTIIMFISTYNQYYNRCSTAVDNYITPSLTDGRLCGSRSCDNGYACINPMSYDQIPNGLLYHKGSDLAFGFFQYDNFLHGYFTIVSTVFLTNASKIIDIFSNSSPILLIACVNIFLIVLSLLFGSPAILVLIEQYIVQKNLRRSPNKYKMLCESNTRMSNNSGIGELNSFAAPTFGPNSNKQIENKFKKNQQEKPLQFKQNQEETNIHFVPLKHKSSKIIPVQQVVKQSLPTESKDQKISNKILQFVTVTFVILVGSAHFGLGLAFIFGNLQEMEKRLVGVCQIVIFIVWSFWMLIKISGLTNDDEKQSEGESNEYNEQNYSVIFTVQIFIYCIHLADYICRIFNGTYVLEQKSALTPLATSLLLFRIIYLPLAFQTVMFTSPFWKNVNFHLLVYKDIVVNIFSYMTFIFCCSLVIATLAREITGLGYFFEFIKYIKIMANLNWIQHYQYSSIQSDLDSSSCWGVVLKLALILLVELFIYKLIYTDAIIESFCAFRQLKESYLKNIEGQVASEQQVEAAVREKKTFFIISFELLNIRVGLHKLINSQNYRGGKTKVTTIYLFAHLIGYCVFQGAKVYQYTILVGDFLLLADACFTIIANRFWGIGSFVNNKWYNLTNFLVSIMVIINLAIPLFDIFFLRVFRVFLVMDFYPQMKAAYDKIIESIAIINRLTIFILVIWIVLALMIGMLFTNTTAANDQTIILSELNLSLKLLEKGFDLPSVIGFNQNGELYLYSIYSFVIYFLISIPIQCILVGMILAFFQHLNNEIEEEEILKAALQDQHQNNGLSAKEDYQKNCIKKQILAFTPVYNPVNTLQPNFILNLLNEYKNIFNSIKIAVIVIDAALLVSLPIITKDVTHQQFLQVKLSRFGFYFLHLMLFILESVVNKAHNNQFYFKLTLYLLSLPGSFIMMVPFHKVQASQELLNLLQCFLMLAPLPSIQLYTIIHKKMARVINFVFNKLENTLWISVWIGVAIAFLSGILTMIINKSFLYVFCMVSIGFCGSNYEITLEKDANFNYIALYIMQIVIFYFGLVLRSVLIATFIFQTVEKLGDSYSNEQSPQITRRDFNAIFQEEKFHQLWNKLDRKSIGMLPFKTVLNHLFHFANCFNLHSYYIEFLLKPKHENFMLKRQLFRRLHFPVRSVTAIQREDKNRSCEYMITMQDIIARFFCLALDENIHKLQQTETLLDLKAETHTIKNWCTRLGFDSEEWGTSTIENINAFNYKLYSEEQQIQEKYYIPKEIEMESWSLASVLSIFPALRRRVAAVKQKLK